MATLASPYAGREGVITGSWFPTGFHGHSRTGRRNDFINEFRQRARPTPPVVFVQRLMERPESHVFSLHDNREAYLRPEQSCAKRELSDKGIQPRLFDGEFFDLGLGKKKLSNSTQNSDNRLFWWVPQKVDFEATGHPDLSSYKSSYHAQQFPNQVYVHQATVGQAAANQPAAITKERFTSMYKYAYNNQNNNGVINVMNNAALVNGGAASQSQPAMGRRRAQTCTDTVRSCLIWPQEKSPAPKQQSFVYTPAPVVTVAETPKASVTPAPAPPTTVVVSSIITPVPPAVAKPQPLPPAGFCDDYGPKPLVFTPLRGNVTDTPYSQEAVMAAKAYKERTSNVLNIPQPPPQYSPPKATTVTTVINSSNELPRPHTTFEVIAPTPAPPAVESGTSLGLARSKSEADLSRPKSTGS